MTNRIQIRRGTDAARLALNGVTDIKVGELLFTTDNKTVFIGDGSTNGGYDFIGNAFTTTAVPVANIDGTQNTIMTFDGSGDALLVGPGTDNHVFQSVAGVPGFAFLAYDNIDSADFITNLTSVPGANKFVDAATIRQYVLDNVNGLSWRPPIDFCDPTEDALADVIGQTAFNADGVAVVNGDRVLFTNLTIGADNDRVYLVGGVGSSITLTLEVDGQAGDGSPTDGDTLFCERGNTNADRTLNFDGTDWISISSLSGALLASNNLSDVANAATSLTNIGGIGAATTDTLTNKTMVSLGAGGTNPLTVDYTDIAAETVGDIFYWTAAGAAAKLGIGTAGQTLTVVAGEPAWSTPSGGTITNSTGSSADNEIVRFDGVTGNLIQNASSARLNDDVTLQTVTYGDLSRVSLDGGVLV